MIARNSPVLTPAAVFSTDSMQRAWQHIRHNGASPGTDGVTLVAFSRMVEHTLPALQHDLLTGLYRPLPVRRYQMVKPSGKTRTLTIWAIRDRIAQRVIADCLTPRLENIFLDSSYGFRPGRGTADAVQAVRAACTANYRWIIESDIADCFDSIPLDLLLGQVRAAIPEMWLVHLIQRWLRTPVHGRPAAGRFAELAGVAQGGVISPLLTNLYLHRFDQTIAAMLPECRLIRYADDFLVLCCTKREASWGLHTVRLTLASLRMHINQAKTRILHADQGFQFLGVTFNSTGLIAKK